MIRLLFILAAGLCNAGVVLAGSAQEHLDRMAHAIRSLNYVGTFVYVHGDAMEIMRIVHSSEEGREHERLSALNGEAREIIRNDDTVTCYFPASRSATVSKARPRTPFPPRLPEDTHALAATYEFIVEPETRLMEHAVYVVNIKPRDQFRYGYRLWLSQQHSLLMRSDLYAPNGEMLEKLMFTELELRSTIAPELLAPTLNTEGFTWRRDLNEPQPTKQAELKWTVAALPQGFDLKSATLRPMGDNPVQHLVYADGLASVSIFAEPLVPEHSPMQGLSQMGALSMYARVVEGHQITVVGEVPPATVEQIAHSVRMVD